MIIYALIILASLFFLAWNLISNRKFHFVASLVTTFLFIVTVGFAIANFSYHYGMHLVNEPVKSNRINSLSPLKALKMISYRPMGTNRGSQMVIYKRGHEIKHTDPDLKVHNRIVRSASVAHAYVVTKDTRWTYRNSWDRAWFNLARRPSTDKVSHVYYVPKSWKILTDKQTLALKQIIKNRGLQRKHQMNSPKIKLQMKQQASEYVTARVASDAARDPKLTVAKKKKLAKQAAKEFKSHVKRNVEKQVAMEALRTSETIH